MKKLLLAIALVGLVGCGKSEEAKKTETAPTPAPATSQPTPKSNTATATATAPATSNTVTATGSTTGQNFTSDYLYENKEIRDQILADCKANKQTEENCKNARVAQARHFNSSEGKTRMKTKVLFGADSSTK